MPKSLRLPRRTIGTEPVVAGHDHEKQAAQRRLSKQIVALEGQAYSSFTSKNQKEETIFNPLDSLYDSSLADAIGQMEGQILELGLEPKDVVAIATKRAAERARMDLLSEVIGQKRLLSIPERNAGLELQGSIAAVHQLSTYREVDPFYRAWSKSHVDKMQTLALVHMIDSVKEGNPRRIKHQTGLSKPIAEVSDSDFMSRKTAKLLTEVARVEVKPDAGYDYSVRDDSEDILAALHDGTLAIDHPKFKLYLEVVEAMNRRIEVHGVYEKSLDPKLQAAASEKGAQLRYIAEKFVPVEELSGKEAAALLSELGQSHLTLPTEGDLVKVFDRSRGKIAIVRKAALVGATAISTVAATAPYAAAVVPSVAAASTSSEAASQTYAVPMEVVPVKQGGSEIVPPVAATPSIQTEPQEKIPVDIPDGTPHVPSSNDASIQTDVAQAAEYKEAATLEVAAASPEKLGAIDETFERLVQKYPGFAIETGVGFNEYQNGVNQLYQELSRDYEANKDELSPRHRRYVEIYIASMKLLAQRPQLIATGTYDPASVIGGKVKEKALHKTTAWLNNSLDSVRNPNSYTKYQYRAIEDLASVAWVYLHSDRIKHVSEAQQAQEQQEQSQSQSHGNSNHGNSGHPSNGEFMVENIDDEGEFDNGYYRQSFEFLLKRGFTMAGAAAVLGNGGLESGMNTLGQGGMNPHRVQGGALSPEIPESVLNGQGGYGIFQWTYPTRQQGLIDYARATNRSTGDLYVQLEFAMKELQGYPELLQTLRTAKPSELDQAAKDFLYIYERPGVPHEAERLAIARKVFDANTMPKPSATNNGHQNNAGGEGKGHGNQEHGQNKNQVPDDFNQRKLFFAQELGISPDAITMTGGADGSWPHFYVNQDTAREKLGIANTYPQEYQNAALDAMVDPWGMYTRECVSWVAHMISTDKYKSTLGHWGGGDNAPNIEGQQSGMADDWDENATAYGVRRSLKPEAGSVIQWDSGSQWREHATFGHVGYVHIAHKSGFIVISQYNAGGTGEFSVEIVSPQLLQAQAGQVEFLHVQEEKGVIG
jgi:surface antigen